MEMFGFEIRRRRKEAPPTPSVVSPAVEDGATIVNSAAAYYGLVVDIGGSVKNENELIRRYRESAQYADCDTAIEDIVNEAISSESDCKPLSIVLDDLKLSPNVKEAIRTEFDQILRLYKFADRGHDIFRQWYVDGRIFFQIIVDEKRPQDGIRELRPIDPRKIRKIKQIHKDKNEKGIEVVKHIEEYYVYNDKGIQDAAGRYQAQQVDPGYQGTRLSFDSVVYVTSGVVDTNGNMALGYLHKAIKPVNQLKMMEDALVIYRISRAPERRIFYVDVGNLPKQRAEQYVNDIMNKFRNKIVYDATTGETKDNRQHLSFQEDFWMPRREGGKGTEITTLQGGQNLGEIEDVQYFQRKLFQSLNVPLSRLQPENNFSLGRSTEITREEIKFNKFIERLRRKFSQIFIQALRVQLITKGIIKAEDWDDIQYDIRFNYQRDNYFAELKNAEIMNNRAALLQQIEPFVGTFYSSRWVKAKVLMQTEEEIEDMEKDLEADLQRKIQSQQLTGEE